MFEASDFYGMGMSRMAVVKKGVFIDAPIEKVFKHAIDPMKWDQWYAGLSGPEKISGDGGSGTVTEFHYSMVGFRLPITIKVEEVTSSTEQCVWKGSFDGGISGTQVFTYTKKDNGTQVEALIDYTVPGKVLGKIANKLVVEKMQENSTEQTLSNLKALLEHE